MYVNSRNIYQSARKTAGITQERAAEMLGISVESVRAYETGIRLPSNDVVDLMVIAYGAQVLAYQHIRASADLVRTCIPDVQERELPTATMRLVRRIYQFADNHRDRKLMLIAEDGRIDEAERPVFNAIVDEINEIIKAALEIQCAREVDG